MFETIILKYDELCKIISDTISEMDIKYDTVPALENKAVMSSFSML